MKSIFLVLCSVCCIAGCGQSSTPDSSAAADKQTTEIRDVVFRSHLLRTLEADPTVRLGEKIRVTPDESEATSHHDSILVQLPGETPYKESDELYFLRGFAVGQLSSHNLQFL